MSESTQPISQKFGLIGFYAILVLLIGGAWFAYDHYAGSSVPVGVELDVGKATRMPRGVANAVAAAARGARNPASPLNMDIAQMPDGVKEMPAGQIGARSGLFYTMFPAKPAANENIRSFYSGKDLVSAETRKILDARRDLVANAQLAAELGITPEQTQKLSKLSIDRANTLRLVKADREQLIQSWQSVSAATDPAARQAATQQFLARLKEIGERSLDGTKKLSEQRVEQIKAILSAEQVQKYLER